MAPLETAQKGHVGGAVDYFLKFEGGSGIAGETQDSKHKGEIELLSWSFGVAQAASIGSATGGAGAGKANFGTFDFSSPVSKASPKLMLACASGDHFKTATLTCRKAGKDQHEYFSVVFDTVLVASETVGHSLDLGMPVDQVSLRYGKIKITYKEQKPDGTAGGAIVGGWDLTSNKAQ